MSEYKSNKYIIKNCPSFCDIENGTGWKEVVKNTCICIRPRFRRPTKCEDIDDCLLKRLVERCRDFTCDCLIENRKCGAMDDMPMCCDLWKGRYILGLLDIEEVDEE